MVDDGARPDFVYTAVIGNRYCAFSGTSQVVQIVNALTGDSLLRLNIGSTVNSLGLHGSFLAVGSEENVVTVHSMESGQEELCLPCSDGLVSGVRLSENSLTFTSGQFAVMYGHPGGFGWREQPEYTVAIGLLYTGDQISERCFEPLLLRHPELINCKHRRSGRTFLHHAVLKVMAEEKVSKMLLGANSRHSLGSHPRISLTPDAGGMTAFHAALEQNRRGWISLLTSAVIEGLVMHTPGVTAHSPQVHLSPRLVHSRCSFTR